MTTIRNTPLRDTPNQQGARRGARGAADASPRRRPPWKAALLAAFALLALGLLAWDVTHAPAYQDRRLARLSLAQLERERGGRMDDPRLLYYVGLRLNQQGRYAEADPLLRNAVGLDPDSPRLRDAWMQALLGSGLTTAAFGEAHEFAGTHTDSAPAYLILGKFYASQNSMVRASEELSHAVALDPKLGEAWSLLAVAQSGRDHAPEALAAAERAVALRPRDAMDRLGLALLQARQGWRPQALMSFTQAVALGPNSAAAHQSFARYLLTTAAGPDDDRRAEAEARRALALDPANSGASLTLGQALTAQGRAAEGLPLLLQAARRSLYDPAPALAVSQTYYRLGQAGPQRVWQTEYRARQRRAQSEADLVTAILKSPDDVRPQKTLARMLAEEGDVVGCLRHQSKALHCAPDAAPAQAAAAEDLAATGHAADALPLAQRATTIAARSPAAFEALADVQLALGQPIEALKTYGRAAALAPYRTAVYQSRLDQYARQHGHGGLTPPPAGQTLLDTKGQ